MVWLQRDLFGWKVTSWQLVMMAVISKSLH